MRHDLLIKWGTSRGRDTYGYTTCALYERGERKAACNGGGYDMRGTVFGAWLESTYQFELLALAKRPGNVDVLNWTGEKYERKEPTKEGRAKYYGATYYRRPRDTKCLPYVALDGACGFESMRRLAENIGLSVRQIDGGRKLDVVIVEGPDK